VRDEKPEMARVIVESPYRGKSASCKDRGKNIAYLRACLRDCLLRGEAPYASHGLYTQEGVLDDDIDEERAMGISAGFAWRDAAELTAVYIDLGVSSGMQKGVEDAAEKGCPVEYRSIPDWLENYRSKGER